MASCVQVLRSVAQKIVRTKQSLILGCIAGLLLWMYIPGLSDVRVADDWTPRADYKRRLQLHLHGHSKASLFGHGLGEISPSQEVPGCIKKVLIFGDKSEMRTWPELREMESILRLESGLWQERTECPHHKCNISWTVGSNVSLTVGMDAVIVGMLPKGFRTYLPDLMRTVPMERQTWIYYSAATPFRVAAWSKTLAFRQLSYHKMMTYRRDSDIYMPFGYYRRFPPGQIGTRRRNYAQGKEDLIVWVGSNCGEETWPRIPYVERLRELLPIRAYGPCGNLTCLPPRSERCNLMMGKFKFYLIMASSECRDYITDTFWVDALGYNVVPVVYGAPREDFEKVAPPDSFIHVTDFPSLEALAEYIRLLDKDDALYNSYFEWKKFGQVQRSLPVTQATMCGILPHLYNETAQRVKFIRDSDWYNGCREQLTTTTGFASGRQYTLYSSWSPWKLTESN